MKEPCNATSTYTDLTDDNMTLLTVQEVAGMLMVGRNRVYELLNSEKIKGIRVGTTNWRIPKLAVYRYIMEESGL